jgi:hypothetical protein
VKHALRSPELKSVALFFALALCVCGCSSSYSVSMAGKPDAEYSYLEMNQVLQGENVTIELKNEGELSAEEVTISNDSMSWVDRGTEAASQASIREIRNIVLKSHGTGALEGLGLGVAGGGALGAFVGQIAVGNGGEWGSGAGAAIGLILGGGTGIIVGVITGAIVGHSDSYEFPAAVQSDSLQQGK